MSSAFVTLDKKGRATLPEDVRAALGVEAGDFIILERTERGTYELVPAALIPKDQLWFYHPEMQARIRKAEANLAAGRVTHTRTLEEARRFLDGLKKRSRRKRVA
jgi:AbrB family looped-hinge helix DNA binding protein